MDLRPPSLTTTITSSSLACGQLAIDVPMEAGMRHPRISLLPSNRSMPGYAQEIKAFREFTHRRVGLICALIEDVEDFFRKCDSGIRSLYLYGNCNDAIWWEVRQPGPEELLLGINLTRGNMSRIKWMQHFATLCDAWLINIAFSSAQNMTAEERERLFHRINSLQTVHTAFLDSDTYRRLCREEEEKVHCCYSKCRICEPRPCKLMSRPAAEQQNNQQTEGEARKDQIVCISCNGRYRANAFWICCDVCKQWYHGKCVKVRAKQAHQMKNFECPECLSEKSGHS